MIGLRQDRVPLGSGISCTDHKWSRSLLAQGFWTILVTLDPSNEDPDTQKRNNWKGSTPDFFKGRYPVHAARARRRYLRSRIQVSCRASGLSPPKPPNTIGGPFRKAGAIENSNRATGENLVLI
jgi:hypothetical protein